MLTYDNELVVLALSCFPGLVLKPRKYVGVYVFIVSYEAGHRSWGRWIIARLWFPVHCQISSEARPSVRSDVTLKLLVTSKTSSLVEHGNAYLLSVSGPSVEANRPAK